MTTSKTDTSVSLSWVTSTDNVRVTEYEIYNGTIKVGTTTGAAIEFTVNGLTESTAYSFTVTAKDIDGNVSVASEALLVTTNTAADTQAPTAPSNLTKISQTDTSVSLSWTASTDNIGVTEYEIYSGTILVGTTTGDTSFVVTNLAQGTNYIFIVKAKDASGNSSDSSNTLNVSTIPAIPGIPANIIATATATTINIVWEAVPNATSYKIEIDGVVKSNITATAYTCTGLLSNTSHNVKVLAINDGGSSVWSDSITVWTLIQAPTNFKIIQSKNTLEASWNAITVAEGYDIEVDGTIIDNRNSITYVHSDLSTGSSHTYRVRAKNSNTKSDWTILITSVAMGYTAIGGAISQDTTLTLSGGPYLVTSNLTVGINVTLTIMPGVVVQFNPGVGMTIDGKVSAVGDAQNKIVFTTLKDPLYGGSGVASLSDYWKAINVEASGEFLGRFISVRYGRCNSARNYSDSNSWGLYTEGKLNLKDSEINNSYKTSISVNGNGTTYIENIQISQSGYNGISVLGNGNTYIKNVQISDCVNNGITVYGNASADIKTVNITNSGNGIVVSKTANSTGSIFITQSTITGNKNTGINIIRAANSTGIVSLTNNTIAENINYGISVDDLSIGILTIENNIISKNNKYGVYIYKYNNGTISIKNNNIKDNYSYPIYVLFDYLKSSIFGSINENIYYGNMLENTPVDEVCIGGNLYSDLTLTNNNSKYIMDYISVRDGKTFTIQPGITLKFFVKYAKVSWIYIDIGKVNAIGTSDMPIILTSIKDKEYGGSGVIDSVWDQWGGIIIKPQGEFNGDYLKVKYGGQNYSAASSEAFRVEGKFVLTNSEISDTGVGIKYFTDDVNLTPIIAFNTFKRLSSSGISNVHYEARMSTVVVDARYNYWNSVYGPNDVVRITSGVDASQWLGSEMKYEFHRGEDIINPATGNFSRKYTDMTLKSPGIDLFLGRTYNSTEDRNDSLLGKGWTFSFDSSIKEYSSKITLQDGTVKSYTLPFIKVVRLSDGSIQMFDVNEDGTFSCKDTRNKLIKQVDGTFILITKDQHRYCFNSSGYIKWIQDKNGNTLTIDVNANGKILEVTDQVGRHFTITYNVQGYIETITDQSNRVVTYQYENNLLVGVIDPMGKVSRYAYDSQGFLNEIRDNDTNLIESVVYNHQLGENLNKVDHTTDKNGNVFTYAYDNINRKTIITDSNGKQTIQLYDISYCTTSSIDEEGKVTSTEYFLDSNGNNKYWEEKAVTDRNGNKTQYQRDVNGNITQITNPNNSVKVMLYDIKNNLISEKDEGGKLTYYIYDSNKINLIKKVQPLNGTDIYADGTSDVTKFAITTYAYYFEVECQQLGYLAKGLLKSVTDPEGNFIKYTYDAYGNVKTVTDGENNTITYNYNNIGWKISEVSSKGFTTTYVYDNNGNLEKTVLNGGETTRTVYDDEGRRSKEIPARLYDSILDDVTNDVYTGDVGTRYTYNTNGTLQSVKDAENNLTSYTYDIYGNVLTETKPDGAIYSYDYDVMNRVTHEYYQENVVSTKVTLTDYSYTILIGKTQKTETKYLNSTDTAITTSIYDYANRLIEQYNPDSTKVYLSYNTNGTKATTTDARGSVTYYKYDGLNRPTEQWTPFESNSGTISYSYSKIDYDKAGRKIAEVIGKDKVALYGITTNVITISYSYYNNNKLKSQTDSSGKRIDYEYDLDGNVSKTYAYVDANTQNITEYQNNYFGKPDIKTVHVRKGDIYGNNFTDNTDTLIQTSYSYDQDGNLKMMTTPDGVLTTYEYDNLDRQLSVEQPGIDENGASTTIKSSSTLRYDGKVLTTTDAKDNETTFLYDGRGEVIKKTDAKNNISVSYYDLEGRKIAEVAPGDYVSGKDLSLINKTEYSYDLMGRLLAIKSVYFDTVANAWKSIVTKAYAYDANGNVTKELDASGYASGTGLTVLEIINSGYGTVTTYNLANKSVTVQDPDTKDRSLAYTVSYSYDGVGRKVSETNAKGTVTTYYYDDASNILKITVKKTAVGVERIIKSATYDGVGNVKTATDGNGNVTNCGYNALNKVKAVTFAADSTIDTDTVTYQYDVMGNLKWQSDSLGKVNIYTYDNQGSVITSTEKALDGSNSISTSIKYDVNGNKRYVTDGNLVTTENIYDELNRLISTSVTVNSVKQTASFGYDANSNKTSVTDWRGNVIQYVYDPLNRLSKKIDAYGKSIETLEYYDNGAQSKSTDALNNVTQYFYDKNRRLIKTIDPENHTTSQTYDAVGNITSKTDGAINVTSYVFDEFNNLLKVTNAKNEVTSYTYDLNKNMLSQTDGKLSTSNCEYNVANKVIRRIDNGGRTGSIGSYIYNPSKTESYTYYADGSLKSKTDRNGLVTNYTYDVHGRKLTENVSTINISYAYDNNGNQLTINDTTGTTTRTYDELNTVTSKTVPSIGKSTYVYDISTDMSPEIWGESITDPKGNVTLKIYDKTGRLLKVTADGKTNTYSYFDNGSLNSITYANGSNEKYTYYKDNLLKTLTNKKSDGTIIDTYSYTYDGAHNMFTKVDGRGTTSYTYDKLNRLYTITQPDTTKTTYVYDAAGNRQTQTVVKGSTSTVTSYSYNDQNKLLSSTTTVNTVKTQTTAYTYDNNGSQLTSIITPYISGIAGTTQTTTNIYDELNQLTQTVTSDGNSIVNIYNGEGVRVAKATNGVIIRYLYEGDKVILELDESGAVVAKNLYGTNLIARTADGIKGYYLYNGHADVTGITAEDGDTLLATYYYDDFGNLIGSTGIFNNSNTYAGYQYDSETKTYYLMARMYDPETARFLQEDSYRGDPNDPLSLNLYTYCHNNPVIYDDPNGHWIHIAIGALVGGAINTAITAASDYLDDGKFNTGWKEYAGSFAEGAIAGGVGAATGGASLLAKAAAGAGAGLLGNTTKQLLTKGKVNWKEAAISTAFDAGIGVAGDYVGKIVKNSKVGKYVAGKAKQQAVNLVENVKAFTQGWKGANPNTVTLGTGFGALQDGIDRVGIAMKNVTEGASEAVEQNYALFNKTHKSSAPVPKGTGPNGGRLQSHHGLQQQWAKENFSKYGYDPDLAPTVTVETGKGMPHTSLSNTQNARRNARVASGNGKWSSSLQDELGYTVDDFTNAGFSKDTINGVLEQQYKMLDKLKVPYGRIDIK